MDRVQDRLGSALRAVLRAALGALVDSDPAGWQTEAGAHGWQWRAQGAEMKGLGRSIRPVYKTYIFISLFFKAQFIFYANREN